MARPERKTVDYFPHYISDGKKMFFIEHKYGNDGYATWFKILESLASTENHFLNLNDSTDLMFLSAKCRIEESILLSIINDLSKLGEIDHDLWLSNIVYSHKFIESIQDAYKRRNNKCMTYEGLCMHLLGLCIHKLHENAKFEYNKPQSKVKYSKVKEIKVNESIEISPEISKPKKEIPSLDEFLLYLKTDLKEFNFDAFKFSVTAKYESWIDNDWKDGNQNSIKNWKTKLKNTMPYLKPFNQNQNGTKPITADERTANYTQHVLESIRKQVDSQEPIKGNENSTDDFTTFTEM
jgi:hypothetical protein